MKLFILNTYIFSPDSEFILVWFSIFFIPAAILWGIAKSAVLSSKTNQVLRSLSLGIVFTALMFSVHVIMVMGTLQGMYHLYSISEYDLYSQLAKAIGFIKANILIATIGALAAYKILNRFSLMCE